MTCKRTVNDFTPCPCGAAPCRAQIEAIAMAEQAKQPIIASMNFFLAPLEHSRERILKLLTEEEGLTLAELHRLLGLPRLSAVDNTGFKERYRLADILEGMAAEDLVKQDSLGVWRIRRPALNPAGAHARMMARLRAASEEELFATVVEAGICSSDGRLLPPYDGSDD